MAYTGPAVNVANWIKNGATTASYVTTTQSLSVSAGSVVVSVGSVASTSGTIIKSANYSDDIRDFLIATLDSVYKIYAAQIDTAIPSNFSVQRVIGSTSLQYLVTVTTLGDVDFPTLA